jgi:hypothetical protein
MAGLLARGLHVVVAGGAAAAHLGVFEARHGLEGHRGMTGFAALGAHDMRSGFRHRTDTRAVVRQAAQLRGVALKTIRMALRSAPGLRALQLEPVVRWSNVAASAARPAPKRPSPIAQAAA